MSKAFPREVVGTFYVKFFNSKYSVFTAPGRVNIIGEHTDYNNGFVLPVAINYYTAIAIGMRNDRIIEAVALDHNNSRVRIYIDEPATHDANAPWSNYLRGMIGELKAEGYQLSGCNMVISGNVPQGAGLSSSASLEMVIATALTTLSTETLDGKLAALIGQAAENNFVGCNCGIMDQLISALGEKNHAMLLDCRTLATRMVKLPTDLSIIVVNSNIARGLVGSQYNTRREQCEAASKYFSVQALRDVNLKQLNAAKEQLDNTIYRRAHHVITENTRTLNAADALESGNIRLLGELMMQSHSSMRDDFEITVPAIDKLVDIIKSVVGTEGGVRMTGGGFGGCVIAVVPKKLENTVVKQVKEEYFESTSDDSIYICTSSQGAFS